MNDATANPVAGIHVERRDGDPDQPTLLLLHGLGATGAVWDPLLAVADWAGPVVV